MHVRPAPAPSPLPLRARVVIAGAICFACVKTPPESLLALSAAIADWASIVLAALPYVVFGALAATLTRLSASRWPSRSHNAIAVFAIFNPGCDCALNGFAGALARAHTALAGFALTFAAAASPAALAVTYAAFGMHMTATRAAGGAIAAALTAVSWSILAQPVLGQASLAQRRDRTVLGQASLAQRRGRIVGGQASLAHSAPRDILRQASLAHSAPRGVLGQASLAQRRDRTVLGQASLAHSAPRGVLRQASLAQRRDRAVRGQASLAQRRDRTVLGQASLAHAEHRPDLPGELAAALAGIAFAAAAAVAAKIIVPAAAFAHLSPAGAALLGALLSPCSTADPLLAAALTQHARAQISFMLAAQCLDVRQMLLLQRHFGTARMTAAAGSAAIACVLATMFA
ncbi:MAG TPA: permease [Candidatus Eremiobacteraceae bacterium]